MAATTLGLGVAAAIAAAPYKKDNAMAKELLPNIPTRTVAMQEIAQKRAGEQLKARKDIIGIVTHNVYTDSKDVGPYKFTIPTPVMIKAGETWFAEVLAELANKGWAFSHYHDAINHYIEVV